MEDCTKPDINLCRDCTWPPPQPDEAPNCWAKKEFKRLVVRYLNLIIFNFVVILLMSTGMLEALKT